MLCRNLNSLAVVFEAVEMLQDTTVDIYGYIVVLNLLASLAARITNPKNSEIRRGVEHIAEALVDKLVRETEGMSLHNDGDRMTLLGVLETHSLKCIMPSLWNKIITTFQRIWNSDGIDLRADDVGAETLVHLDEYEEHNLFEFEMVKNLDSALRIHLGYERFGDAREFATDVINAVAKGATRTSTEMFVEQVCRAKRTHITKLSWIKLNNLSGVNESKFVSVYKIGVRSGDGPRYVEGLRIWPHCEIVIESSLEDDLGYAPPQSIERGALHMTHGLDDLTRAVLRFKLLEDHEDDSAILSVIAGIYIGFILRTGTSYCLSTSRSSTRISFPFITLTHPNSK